MSEAAAAPGSLPLTALERIERICTRFEDAWKEGRQPSIEAHLGDSTQPERSALLRELLVLDLSYRRRRGQKPSPPDYLQRFREHQDLIRTVFGEVVAVKPNAADAAPSRQSEPEPTTLTDPQETSPPVRAPGGDSGQSRFPPIPGYEILGELGRGGMGVVTRRGRGA